MDCYFDPGIEPSTNKALMDLASCNRPDIACKYLLAQNSATPIRPLCMHTFMAGDMELEDINGCLYGTKDSQLIIG